MIVKKANNKRLFRYQQVYSFTCFVHSVHLFFKIFYKKYGVKRCVCQKINKIRHVNNLLF